MGDHRPDRMLPRRRRVPDRMAGARRETAAASGHRAVAHAGSRPRRASARRANVHRAREAMRRRHRARLFTRNRSDLTGVSLERRRALSWLVVPAIPLSAGAAHGAPLQIASARLWPAQEYTRLILESTAPIEYQLVMLKQPNRVVLDLARV